MADSIISQQLNKAMDKLHNMNLGSFGNEVAKNLHLSTEYSQDGMAMTLSGIYTKTDGNGRGGTVLKLTDYRRFSPYGVYPEGYTPPNLKIGNNDDWYGHYLDVLKSDATTDDTRRAEQTSTKMQRIYNIVGSKFGDYTDEYFRYGLQMLDEINRIEDYSSVSDDGLHTQPNITRATADTPIENNDPIIFGFDIIIDAESSPLLNGAVDDFIDHFAMVSEIESKKAVLMEFKNQFYKIFKTNTQNIRTSQSYSNQVAKNIGDFSFKVDNPATVGTNDALSKAYLAYYLKKVSGLDKLIESNEPIKIKGLTKYREDVITLSAYEDVSMSFGTLAYLYKLLAWSKPNGKNIIPDNLLTFNCDIIISEIRNYNRIKQVDEDTLQILADNLSRYVYSLKECNFFFNKPVHDDSIDMSATQPFNLVDIMIDYKYVTCKFEKWNPRLMKYIVYDNGAQWKRGSAGNVDTSSVSKRNTIVSDFSVPSFHRSYNEDSPIIDTNVKTKIASKDDSTEKADIKSSEDPAETVSEKQSYFDNLKESLKKSSKTLMSNIAKSTALEISIQVGSRLQLINKSVDNIRTKLGIGRMKGQTNIYGKSFESYLKSVEKGETGNSGISGYNNVYSEDYLKFVQSMRHYSNAQSFWNALLNNGKPLTQSVEDILTTNIRNFAGDMVGSLTGGVFNSNLISGGNGNIY